MPSCVLGHAEQPAPNQHRSGECWLWTPTYRQSRHPSRWWSRSPARDRLPWIAGSPALDVHRRPSRRGGHRESPAVRSGLRMRGLACGARPTSHASVPPGLDASPRLWPTELALPASSGLGLWAANPSRIVMFWNWIGRSQGDIAQAREDWMNGTRFGEVKGYDGPPLPAPDLPPAHLKPRGRVR